MRAFAQIRADAVAHKGGEDALERLLPPPEDPAALKDLPDDRVLSEMTRRVFQAGFNWKVIDNKWPGFEEAFEGFEPSRWVLMSDEDVVRLMQDGRIVRHEAKIRSVAGNAALVRQMAQEAGSAGLFLADWPDTDFVGLLDFLKTRGSRLGGTSAQYLLRTLGKPSLILSRDVTAALVREGVVERPPSSKRDLAAVQEACNAWMAESGLGLTRISRILAISVG